MHSVMVPGAAVFLALGCGGRYIRDGDVSAGAGRTSVLPEGGAPSLSEGGAGNAPSSAAGAPSAGAPSAGAPSAGAPSAGAPSACQSMNGAPNGVPPDPEAQDVSGEYQLVTCGEDTPCTQLGAPVMTQALSDRIGLSVSQNDDDLIHGTVTLHGTGELLLDDRAFDAEFTGRSFKVELNGPISAVCSQEYNLSFSYDFDGYGPRIFNWDFERSPKCTGNDGSVDCKGNAHGTFGDAMRVPE
ncbi:MAG TPA: hypothetical protein VGF76_17015 [Polyangiaceae bacterium]